MRIKSFGNYGIAQQSVDIILMMAHRDFDKGLALYSGMKGQLVLVVSLSSFNSHSLTFSISIVQFCRQFYVRF